MHPAFVDWSQAPTIVRRCYTQAALINAFDTGICSLVAIAPWLFRPIEMQLSIRISPMSMSQMHYKYSLDYFSHGNSYISLPKLTPNWRHSCNLRGANKHINHQQLIEHIEYGAQHGRASTTVRSGNASARPQWRYHRFIAVQNTKTSNAGIQQPRWCNQAMEINNTISTVLFFYIHHYIVVFKFEMVTSRIY